MRILVSTAGSHGDVLPFIALGRELKARGHDVILFANPFFRRHADNAGLILLPIGTVAEYAAVLHEVSEGNPRKAFRRVARHFAGICGPCHQAMRAHAVPGRTIAIGNSLLFAHLLLKETSGIPCATVHLAPAVFRSNIRPPRLMPIWINQDTPTVIKNIAWWATDTFFYEPYIAAPLNKLRAELGLPRVMGVLRSWVNQADVIVGLFPEWFGEPQPDWPADVALTGFPLYDQGDQLRLPPELDAFLSAGTPPVAFSAGTATATARVFFEASVDACRISGRRGILLTHFPEQIPDPLPSNVIHVDYAPFSILLPRLAAFVHHGGIGATSQALRAGVPQLIRPVAYDQFDNSDRAVRLGVAHEILSDRYTGHAVAGMLEQITTDSLLKQRCRQAVVRFDQGDAIEAACDSILARLDKRFPKEAVASTDEEIRGVT